MGRVLGYKHTERQHQRQASSVSGSITIEIHGDASLPLENGGGVDFQAAGERHHTHNGSNLTLMLTLDTRSVHSFTAIIEHPN